MPSETRLLFFRRLFRLSFTLFFLFFFSFFFYFALLAIIRWSCSGAIRNVLNINWKCNIKYLKICIISFMILSPTLLSTLRTVHCLHPVSIILLHNIIAFTDNCVGLFGLWNRSNSTLYSSQINPKSIEKQSLIYRK